ncbi:hypothetical protein ACE6H2_018850 [Prunus campanulata]
MIRRITRPLSRAKEVNRRKLEEELRLEEVQIVEEATLSLGGKEKVKCRAAMEAAEAAQRIAELETQKRRNVELKALREAEHRKTVLESNAYDLRYRKYTIEEIETATNDFSDGKFVSVGRVLFVSLELGWQIHVSGSCSWSCRWNYGGKFVSAGHVLCRAQLRVLDGHDHDRSETRNFS